MSASDAGARPVGEETRDSTLLTFVSTTGTCWPNEKHATACAVYTPDAGKRFQFLDASRKSAAMLFQDNESESLKTQRTIVVSQPFPGFDDIRCLRPGELFQRRKPPEKLRVFRQDSRNLGLLQHEFRNEEAIGVGLIPPWQIAPVFPVPPEDGGREKRFILQDSI